MYSQINRDDVVHRQLPTNFRSRPGTVVSRLCPNFLPAMPPIFPNSIIGTTLANRYILLNRLDGIGSDFRRCIHIQSNQEYVFMVVAKDSYQDLLRVCNRLESHPYVNPVKEIIVGNSQTYIVCESFYGNLLSYVRKNRKIPESEGLRLFKQMASAVVSCHDKGIILKDLRLSKFVFKDPEKTQVIFDTLINAVVFEGDNDWLEDCSGCPNYVSPDFFFRRNHKYQGRAADCWSLGIILYTMLVGCYPFCSKDSNVLASKVMCCCYNLPQHLSSEAKYLIIGLLQKDPSKRLTAKGALNFMCLGSVEELPENNEQIVPLQKGRLPVRCTGFPVHLSKDEHIVPR